MILKVKRKCKHWWVTYHQELFILCISGTAADIIDTCSVIKIVGNNLMADHCSSNPLLKVVMNSMYKRSYSSLTAYMVIFMFPFDRHLQPLVEEKSGDNLPFVHESHEKTKNNKLTDLISLSIVCVVKRLIWFILLCHSALLFPKNTSATLFQCLCSCVSMN